MHTTKIYKSLFLIHLVVMVAALGCGASAAINVQQLAALEAKALIEKQVGNPNFVILDIRTPKEFNQGHIANAVMLDYYSPGFIQGLQKLDKTKTYLIYCRSGNRSSRTLRMIEKMGFQKKTYHLQRGIIEWTEKKYPLVK